MYVMIMQLHSVLLLAPQLFHVALRPPRQHQSRPLLAPALLQLLLLLLVAPQVLLLRWALARRLPPLLVVVVMLKLVSRSHHPRQWSKRSQARKRRQGSGHPGLMYSTATTSQSRYGTVLGSVWVLHICYMVSMFCNFSHGMYVVLVLVQRRLQAGMFAVPYSAVCSFFLPLLHISAMQFTCNSLCIIMHFNLKLAPDYFSIPPHRSPCICFLLAGALGR